MKKLRKPKRNLELEQLLIEIKETQKAMDTANCNFDYALDHDLIDSSIFEVNSIHKRYKYLLERAKEVDLNCNTTKIKERTIS